MACSRGEGKPSTKSQLGKTNKDLQVKYKVRKQIAYLKRISGSTWGVSLHGMRELYLTKVRPIISYGCAVWFIRGKGIGRSFEFGTKLIGELESLQYECLKEISGAYKRTSRRCLLKELWIPSIESYLRTTAMGFRARMLDTEHAQVLHDNRFKELPGVQNLIPRSKLEEHPYHILDVEAKKFLEDAQRHWQQTPYANLNWDNPLTRKDAIKAYSRELREQVNSASWKRYQHDCWLKGRQQLYLSEGWGRQTLDYHKGLSRAQSSMLIQCRTENIGLNSYLFRCSTAKHQVSRTVPQAATGLTLFLQIVETDRCLCGEGEHPEACRAPLIH